MGKRLSLRNRAKFPLLPRRGAVERGLLSAAAMTALADRLDDVLEKLITDRRARIAGAIIGALMLVVSFGFLAASKSEVKRSAASMAAHLPAAPLNIPILRYLPEPQPRKGAAVERVSAPTRKAKVRYVTARR